MAREIHFVFSILITLALMSVPSYAKEKVPNPKVFALQVIKDQTTKQYYATFGFGTKPQLSLSFVLDLGGPMTWLDCHSGSFSSSYQPIPCNSATCRSIGTKNCVNSTCLVNAYNPLTGVSNSGEVFQDVATLLSDPTNRGAYGPRVNTPPLVFSCPAPAIRAGKMFPARAQGVLGLSQNPISFPNQISSSFRIPRSFALCLPSKTDYFNGNGDLFIGGPPYNLYFYNDDADKLLTTTTPLVMTDGKPSNEFLINVKSIRIDGKPLSFNGSLLTIDNGGCGGTRLSTVTPYGVLHRSIYGAMVKEFTRKAELRNMSRVAPVAPFGACFSTESIGKTRTGPDVPVIELMVDGGGKWRIYGANSMVKLKDVRCLGFVDGGEEVESGIVIGGLQMEDHLLEFDLQSSKLRFSSSLLLHKSPCYGLRFGG